MATTLGTEVLIKWSLFPLSFIGRVHEFTHLERSHKRFLVEVLSNVMAVVNAFCAPSFSAKPGCLGAAGSDFIPERHDCGLRLASLDAPATILMRRFLHIDDILLCITLAGTRTPDDMDTRIARIAGRRECASGKRSNISEHSEAGVEAGVGTEHHGSRYALLWRNKYKLML